VTVPHDAGIVGGEKTHRRQHQQAGVEQLRPVVLSEGVRAFVDWDRLAGSWLSSTERAAVIIARGVAQAERNGGLPPRVARVVANASAGLSPSSDRHRNFGTVPADPTAAARPKNRPPRTTSSATESLNLPR
jgi:hypothetical protein